MLIYSGKVIYTWSQEPSVITTKEELKKVTARLGWKNIITQGWRRTEEDWKKKRGRSAKP